MPKGLSPSAIPSARGTWNYPLKGGQKKDAREFCGVGKLTARFNRNTPGARLKLRIW
ncbi:MAG: hypothetical protein JSW39_26190 [Desulfobacterales bacterium]|nr:MAG: hypothetical protein JSW39_26190 [Desulfobacterales bacterium]